VDHIGFRRYSNTLYFCLRFLVEIPYKNINILKFYDDERAMLMHKLENDNGKVAITTEM
jgi:hypothetical protein